MKELIIERAADYSPSWSKAYSNEIKRAFMLRFSFRSYRFVSYCLLHSASAFWLASSFSSRFFYCSYMTFCWSWMVWLIFEIDASFCSSSLFRRLMISCIRLTYASSSFYFKEAVVSFYWLLIYWYCFYFSSRASVNWDWTTCSSDISLFFSLIRALCSVMSALAFSNWPSTVSI